MFVCRATRIYYKRDRYRTLRQYMHLLLWYTVPYHRFKAALERTEDLVTDMEDILN